MLWSELCGKCTNQEMWFTWSKRAVAKENTTKNRDWLLRQILTICCFYVPQKRERKTPPLVLRPRTSSGGEYHSSTWIKLKCCWWAQPQPPDTTTLNSRTDISSQRHDRLWHVADSYIRICSESTKLFFFICCFTLAFLYFMHPRLLSLWNPPRCLKLLSRRI